MSTLAIDLEFEPDPALPRFIDREKFRQAAENWSQMIQGLTEFEDAHLLLGNPPAGKLARHKEMVERLMFVGQLFATVTAHPNYEDSATANMISATQNVLREKFRMFHKPMSKERADEVLRGVCF